MSLFSEKMYTSGNESGGSVAQTNKGFSCSKIFFVFNKECSELPIQRAVSSLGLFQAFKIVIKHNAKVVPVQLGETIL